MERKNFVDYLRAIIKDGADNPDGNDSTLCGFCAVIYELLETDTIMLAPDQKSRTIDSIVRYANKFSEMSPDGNEEATAWYAAVREIVGYLHDIAILQRLDMLLDHAHHA